MKMLNQWPERRRLVAGRCGAGAAGAAVRHHEAARPLTFTIGVGLAGEGAITLIRAARRGIEMPWKELGNQVHDRLQNRS